MYYMKRNSQCKLTTFSGHFFPLISKMAVLIGDSCCRGMRVPGVVVQAVGGLLASNSLDPEGPCSSVILAVGGNDLANGLKT